MANMSPYLFYLSIREKQILYFESEMCKRLQEWDLQTSKKTAKNSTNN